MQERPAQIVNEMDIFMKPKDQSRGKLNNYLIIKNFWLRQCYSGQTPLVCGFDTTFRQSPTSCVSLVLATLLAQGLKGSQLGQNPQIFRTPHSLLGDDESL